MSFIKQKQNQLKNYNKQYLEFLNKTGRTRVSANEWIGKANIKGLSGDNSLGSAKHKPPKLIKTIKNTSKENIIKELENYEKLIKDDIIENAIVITQKGKIYHCFGNESNVWPDIDLKGELKGSYVTHNHPNVEQNINTFTMQDRNLFYNNELKVLRGTKGDYVFELNRDENFKEKIPTIAEIEQNIINIEHVRNIQYSYDFNVGYKRWKND